MKNKSLSRERYNDAVRRKRVEDRLNIFDNTRASQLAEFEEKLIKAEVTLPVNMTKDVATIFAGLDCVIDIDVDISTDDIYDCLERIGFDLPSMDDAITVFVVMTWREMRDKSSNMWNIHEKLREECADLLLGEQKEDKIEIKDIKEMFRAQRERTNRAWGY